MAQLDPLGLEAPHEEKELQVQYYNLGKLPCLLSSSLLYPLGKVTSHEKKELQVQYTII